MMQKIYLSPPHMSGLENQYVQEAFDTNWIAPIGPNVDGFEQDVMNYVGAGHALALSSGTAGIHLALKYIGIQRGDYVFCSDLTFAGSCNPILYEQAVPVFIDSEPNSWNMSPAALERAFAWANVQGTLPKAVIIVDLYGQSADYDQLLPICEQYGVPVIEDAAEALGATYHGKHCGTFGHIGVYSFNGNKIITTSGGGMVVSNDEASIHKMKFWATQAREQTTHYEHAEVGYNYRLSNICAGIGRGQLQVLEDRMHAKRGIRARYEERLRDMPVSFMPLLAGGQANHWLTVMTIDKSCHLSTEQIITSLEQDNIEARPVWKPMHLQPLFQDYMYFSHDGDVGSDLFQRGICLPSGTALTEEDQDRVIQVIRSCMEVIMT